MTADEIIVAMNCPTIRKGATPEGMEKLQQTIGHRLPSSYVDLMNLTNGIEGFVGNVKYLMLWPVEEQAELNEGYGAKEFAPGLWLIGSNGGDAGYAFDTRRHPMPIMEVPFLDMSSEDAKEIAPNFEGLIDYLQTA